MYWWLLLRKGMYQLPENIPQHILIFSRFRKKKRFQKLVAFHRICAWKTLIKAATFYNFYPIWNRIGGFYLKECTKLEGIYYKDPIFFRFSNIRFQKIDSAPPYIYLKNLIETTDFRNFWPIKLHRGLQSVTVIRSELCEKLF